MTSESFENNKPRVTIFTVAETILSIPVHSQAVDPGHSDQIRASSEGCCFYYIRIQKCEVQGKYVKFVTMMRKETE